ncbi:MAG TPA: MFS transporter [Streptosporangiaceae bacterium]
MGHPADGAAAGLSRGGATWLLYGLLSCFGFLLNGLGAILDPLQRDLHVSRAQVAFYPTLFAAGLLIVGLAGGPLVGRIGRMPALRAALVGMVAGGLLLATTQRALTIAGALLLGLGGALLVQLLPVLLAALHPGAATAAVGEANGLASTASILGPLAVAGALSAGIGWRAGYLAAPLAFLLALIPITWRVALPDTRGAAGPVSDADAAPLLGRWFDVLLAVSVEFCMVFWAASAMTEWRHAGDSAAPAVAALFLVGMAGGRAVAAPVTRRFARDQTLLLACAAVAAAGFAAFWLAPGLVLSGAGLLIVGWGVALMYPTTVSRVVAAWPHAPDRAGARGALASGVAIGGAPYLLARLADAVGLRIAYLIVPGLLLALAVRVAADRGGPRR